MKSWAQGLKQWSLWLFGEGALPGRRARIMLAATVVVVAVLGVGTAWAVQPQGNGPKSAASRQRIAAYDLAVKERAKKHHEKDKKAGSGSKDTSKKKKKKSSTTSAQEQRAAAYRKAVALALANRASKNHKHSGKSSKNKKAKKNQHAKDSSVTENSLSAVGGSSLLNSPTSVFATTNVTGTGEDSVPGAPSAPDLNGATSGHRGSRLNWSAPASNGSSITGYNVYVGIHPGAEYPEPVNGAQPVTGRSYLVNHLSAGTTYYFTVRAINRLGISAPSNEVSAVPGVSFQAVGALPAPVVTMASSPQGNGYWMANPQGAIATLGAVGDYGSTDGLALNAPIVQLVATSDGYGYWEVASDGGIFAFGDAGFYGSMGGLPLNAPIVGLAEVPGGGGYWEVASDGGVFAFGDAGFYGSMGGKPMDQPVVGITADPANGGYWEVTADGHVFGFGGCSGVRLARRPGLRQLGGRPGQCSRRPGLLGGHQRRRGVLLRIGDVPRLDRQPASQCSGRGHLGRSVHRRVLVVLRGRRPVRLRRPVRRGGLSRSDQPGPARPAPLLGLRLRSSARGPGTSTWCAPSSPRTGRRCRPGGARR